MRGIIILLISLAVGKFISIYHYNAGFFIFVFCAILFIFFPKLFGIRQIPRYQNIAEDWLKCNGIKSYEIKYKPFRKGPTRFRTSDLQHIFNATTRDGRNLWFSFGGYFAGAFSKKFTIFENGKKSGPYNFQ
jgi:hypothetical protein